MGESEEFCMRVVINNMLDLENSLRKRICRLIIERYPEVRNVLGAPSWTLFISHGKSSVKTTGRINQKYKGEKIFVGSRGQPNAVFDYCRNCTCWRRCSCPGFPCLLIEQGGRPRKQCLSAMASERIAHDFLNSR